MWGDIGRARLLERGGERRDGVVVRAALVAGEDSLVDGPLQVVRHVLPLLVDGAHTLAEEDHRATRAAQRLVRSGGDDVGVVEGCGYDPRGHEA